MLITELLRFKGFWTHYAKVNPLLENPVEARDEWTLCLTSFLYRQGKPDNILHSHDTKLVRVMTLLVERGCDVNVILRRKDRLRTFSVNDILCRSALEVVESLP